MAGAGWRDYFKDKGDPWDAYGSAEAFRQRHMRDAMNNLASRLKRGR